MTQLSAVAKGAARSGAGLGFYGWRVVGASCIGLALCQSPIAFLTMGIFIKPLSAAFGWGRGEIALALSAGALTIAFVTPAAGRLIDKYGARRVMLPSMLGFGLLMASLSLLTPSLWHYYAIFVLIGVVGSGANNTAFVRVLSAWFVKSRGLALGIATAGVGVGAAIAPIVAQTLIGAFGWRVAYVGLGAMVLFVGIPVVAIFIRDKPADIGLSPYGEEAASGLATGVAAPETGVHVSQALRSRVFWTLMGTALTFAFAIHGMMVHLVPLFVDKGISPNTAALLTSLLGLLSVFARIVSGRLFDSLFAPRIGVVLCVCGILAVLIPLVLPGSFWTALLVALLIGGGAGAESDLLAYLASRYFGVRSIGVLYGYVFCAVMLGTAGGPFVYGVMFDHFHSYNQVLAASAGLLCIAALLLFTLPKFPKFGAEEEAMAD